jgi:hypothetical protein
MRRQPFEAVVARHGPMVLRVCRAVPVAQVPERPSAQRADGLASLRKRYPSAAAQKGATR